MTNTPHTIVLVSCVGRKLDTAAPAQDLYQSQWFKAARAYAEGTGDGWYILSAKFGLVAPTAMLKPYDETLSSTKVARKIWARKVAVQVRHIADPSRVTLVMLAGLRYRVPLVDYFDGYTVAIPMRGLGIGQQLHWLKQQEVA